MNFDIIRLCSITGIPGEPFGELGRIIKQESKPFWGLPVGYANGYLGYIAPKAAWEKGGYEVSLGPWSKTGYEGFDMVVDTFSELQGIIRKSLE